MSTLERVIRYYIEGDIDEFELRTFCANVGMTDQSIERTMRHAYYQREKYLARLEREKKDQGQSGEEKSL